MKIADFDVYATLLKEQSGLVLSPDKTYLLESRLLPVAKEFGFPSLDTMTMTLHGVAEPKLVTAIVEAMTTNETSFFRDTRPFDTFKDVLLDYMKNARQSQKRLRIWCAAASSGQEPYTLAMILSDLASQFPGWSFDILATDISDDILDQAREGLYTQFEVQRGLPIQYLMKYFVQEDKKWRIKDEIKRMVRFQNFNLLSSMAALGTFDIVFCRNVLIYFDQDTKGSVLDNISKRTEKDGFLVLGGAETVMGITDMFVPLPNQRGVYVHSDSPHLADTEKAKKALP